jgi:tetratricopeptide (TPR) repeat protein
VRVLKWLFHPVYLLLIIVAIALYLNRDTLFPDLAQSTEVGAVVSKVESLIDNLHSEPPSAVGRDDAEETDIVFGEEAGSDMPSFGDIAAAETATAQQQSVSPGAGVDEATPPAAIVANSEVETEASSPAEVFSEAEAIAETSSEPVEPAQDEASPALAAIAPKPAASAPVDTVDAIADQAGEPPAAPAVSREQLLHTWQQARIAAWRGDVNTAIEYYQTVITLQPDNYDAYGEMGNVMLRVGDYEGAAEAYYQAAHLLNKTPQRMMAWQLLNVIARLSPQRAEKLYQELTQP